MRKRLGRHIHARKTGWCSFVVRSRYSPANSYTHATSMARAYRKLWLLGACYLVSACFLSSTRYYLLSACAINRVYAGGERSSENHCMKNTQHTQLSFQKPKKSYTVFPPASHILCGLRLDYDYVGSTTGKGPAYYLSTQWL